MEYHDISINDVSMSNLRNQNYKNENTDTKKYWYSWLINYIPKISKEMLSGVKHKIMIREPARVNNAYGGPRKPRKPKIIRRRQNN